ncbi:ethanolamine ammonia-lyase subunit EutC [Zavarzinia compransoris]|uniref:Ethanolamine ammonia-lyase small subunit n=1 Tax=Zavarzinia compransoris TaxID=1264899 RepID=A0A317E2T2_9PROT|nr:ethanolamine ammonia-lyase subunit EutC [Zavarzinia compransoris]PWR19693.1 ethanolamine ammonia-lyase [Zavarzinia compransoris]TDP43361.1 ethanolamine ammonia-lyase light chain [Zavarzinia compransoris]
MSDGDDGALIPAPASLADLRRHTAARVALGRAGNALPTAAHLQFTLDHAKARDAVWSAIDGTRLIEALRARGLKAAGTASRAGDRATYVRRPDLGRQLPAETAAGLRTSLGPARIVLVIADGLSAAAVEANALALVDALAPRLAAEGHGIDAAVVVEQGRVAIGDPIGAALGADLVIMLIGERPGLSAADSLGCYLTFRPVAGMPDSGRNCVSNIRPEGLPPANAAFKIAWLAREALRRELTGIDLKEESAAELAARPAAALIEGA